MHTLKLPSVAVPVEVASITHIEGNGCYVWVHCQPNRQYLLSKTVKCLAIQLPSFLRIHKASLINPAHITLIRKKGRRGMRIQLSSGITLAVSQHRVKQVSDYIDQMKNYAQARPVSHSELEAILAASRSQTPA